MNKPNVASKLTVKLSAESTRSSRSLYKGLLSATRRLRLGASAAEENYCSNHSKLESYHKSNQNSHEVIFYSS